MCNVCIRRVLPVDVYFFTKTQMAKTKSISLLMSACLSKQLNNSAHGYAYFTEHASHR